MGSNQNVADALICLLCLLGCGHAKAPLTSSMAADALHRPLDRRHPLHQLCLCVGDVAHTAARAGLQLQAVGATRDIAGRLHILSAAKKKGAVCARGKDQQKGKVGSGGQQQWVHARGKGEGWWAEHSRQAVEATCDIAGEHPASSQWEGGRWGVQCKCAG